MKKRENNKRDAQYRRDTNARGQQIGEQLKHLYDAVAKEPIPEDFLKLLEAADEKSKGTEDLD